MDRIFEKSENTSFAIPDPTYGKNYKWRVDSVSQFGTVKGEEWEFETRELLHVGPGAGFTATRQRLLAAAGNAIWYEEDIAEMQGQAIQKVRGEGYVD